MRLKLLTIILICVASTSHPSAAAQNNDLPDGFRYLSAGNTEYETYDAIRKKAVKYIQQASKNPGNNLNEKAVALGNDVVEQLLLARFAISLNSKSEKYCDKDIFVSANYPHVLFMCGSSRTFLRSATYTGLLSAVQLFIHEGVHMVDHKNSGYVDKKYDECMPTYFELLIMDNNVGRNNIPSMMNRNDYGAQCDFFEYNEKN